MKKIIKRTSYLLISLAFVFIPFIASAQNKMASTPENLAARLVVWILRLIASILGMVLNIAGDLLNLFLQESSVMVKLPGVVDGWQFVRDVTNMAFIIILLVIAVATIMTVENYHYKKLLPQLLLAIIVVY